MKIITGATQTPQITSNDDGEFNLAIWGSNLVVLPNGSRLSYEIISGTQIHINDGDLVFQGRHALIEAGSYDTINFTAGSSGYNRIDLIVAHYEADTNGYESIDLRVIEGTQTTGTPSAPTYTSGNIREGSTVAEAVLYAVYFTGVNMSLTMVAPVYESIIQQIASKQPIINGAVSSVVDTNLTGGRAVVTDASGKLAVSSLPAENLSYISTLNGDISVVLNGKQNVITGAASSVANANLTGGKIVTTNADGKITVSDVNASQLAYLADVTSNIGEKLDSLDIQLGTPWEGGHAVALGEDNELYTISSVTPTNLGYLSGLDTNVKAALDSKPTKGTWTAAQVVGVNSTTLNVETTGVAVIDLKKISGFTTDFGGKTLTTVLNNKQDIITGSASSVTTGSLTADRVVITNNNRKLAGSSVTTTELGYLKNVSSNIQTQLNSKAEQKNWTASRVIISNSSGNLQASSLTATEALYLRGVNSSVQAQLDAKVAKTTFVADETATTSAGTGTVSVSSGSVTNAGNFALEAGKYTVTIYLSFSANSSGYRYVYLAESSGGNRISPAHSIQCAPSPSGQTSVALTCVLKPSSTTRYYICVQQNSGSTLTVSGIRYSYMGVKS